MPDQLRHDERYGRVSDHPLAAPHHGWQSAPSMPMEKTFDPAAIEANWAHEWESRGLFRPACPDATPFTIVTPPPNVTGALHIGHAERKSVVSGKRVSVRVDIDGRRNIKKKKHEEDRDSDT